MARGIVINIPHGTRFGRLTTVGEAFRHKSARSYVCVCDCGNKRIVPSQSLRECRQVSCGCYRVEQIGKTSFLHGMSKTPIHNLWLGMIQRCTDVNNHAYASYGGRGIKVSIPWLKFVNFYADMGDVPPGLTLDRRDNDKGYSKENCHWVTPKAQANNRRSSKMLTFEGKTQTQRQWEEEKELSEGMINGRIARGWTVERAIGTPILNRQGQPK